MSKRYRGGETSHVSQPRRFSKRSKRYMMHVVERQGHSPVLFLDKRTALEYARVSGGERNAVRYVGKKPFWTSGARWKRYDRGELDIMRMPWARRHKKTKTRRRR